MEDCKELRIEADTFEKLRRDDRHCIATCAGNYEGKGEYGREGYYHYRYQTGS